MGGAHAQATNPPGSSGHSSGSQRSHRTEDPQPGTRCAQQETKAFGSGIHAREPWRMLENTGACSMAEVPWEGPSVNSTSPVLQATSIHI